MGRTDIENGEILYRLVGSVRFFIFFILFEFYFILFGLIGSIDADDWLGEMDWDGMRWIGMG